jgi:proline dehydrogenase
LSLINNAIVSVVKRMPESVVWQFSKRYIAGTTLNDAVDFVKKLNEKGIYATIDVLGESVQSKEEAVTAKQKALEVLEAIEKNKLMANLSIKPTQMGLGIDEEFTYKNVYELVESAAQKNNFVRIDMEDSPFTDKTIALYKKLHEKLSNVGIVVQACLRRTEKDVLALNPDGCNYRIVKGIYVEPVEISYRDRQEIRDNYLKVLEIMLKDGNYVGIATHDEYLINKAYGLIKKYNVPKDKFEFQMLLGVREDLRDKINADGYKIRIYVPFGKDWFAYCTRRLKENPDFTKNVIKSVFGFK